MPRRAAAAWTDDLEKRRPSLRTMLMQPPNHSRMLRDGGCKIGECIFCRPQREEEARVTAREDERVHEARDLTSRPLHPPECTTDSETLVPSLDSNASYNADGYRLQRLRGCNVTLSGQRLVRSCRGDANSSGRDPGDGRITPEPSPARHRNVTVVLRAANGPQAHAFVRTGPRRLDSDPASQEIR